MTKAELKGWRKARGWSLTRAAQEFGVHRSTWMKYENGSRKISRRVLKIVGLMEDK
jgi:transcriptional regulator with XRE-family HTH domain